MANQNEFPLRSFIVLGEKEKRKIKEKKSKLVA